MELLYVDWWYWDWKQVRKTYLPLCVVLLSFILCKLGRSTSTGARNSHDLASLIGENSLEQTRRL